MATQRRRISRMLFYDDLVSQIDAQLQTLAQVLKTDVPAFNQLVRKQNVPAVVVKSPRPEPQQP